MTRRKPASGDSVSCPISQHVDRLLGDSGQPEHLPQGNTSPLTVADTPRLPLGAGSRSPLNQIEHSPLVAGAFQVGDERTTRQLPYVVVGQLQRIRNGVARDRQPPVGYIHIETDGVIAYKEQVVGRDQPFHILQASFQTLAIIMDDERRRVLEPRLRVPRFGSRRRHAPPSQTGACRQHGGRTPDREQLQETTLIHALPPHKPPKPRRFRCTLLRPYWLVL